MKSMNRKIGVGVLWNLASMFLTRGASTIFMLFLARLLAPEAFGLVAMAMVVFELANAFINSGLGAALIRSKEVSGADLSTVFYSNLGLSLVAYAAIFASAPYIAAFYNQPELAALVQIMGLVVFINAARVVQTAVLSRKMDFKTQMKANTLATLVSGVLAVTAAYHGWGVWSLVVQMLSQAAVSAFILWVGSSWRPSWQFSTESFTRLFAFGRNLLAEGILSVLYQNSYILVIGRFFSAELTGLYYFAKKVSNLISKQLTGAVQQATFPALSTLQDDNPTLKYKYRQIMQLMMFLIAPIMMLLAGLSPTLIGLAFDARWQSAVPYLQLLCVVGMLYPLHALNLNLLKVKGRADLVLKVGLLKKSVNLTLLFLAIPYGVIGIVVSQVLATFLALVPNTYFSAKLVEYSLREQVTDVTKPIAAAILAGLSAFWVAEILQIHPAATLLFSGMVGTGIYVLASMIIRAEGLLMLWSKVRKRLNKVRVFPDNRS
ncbi:MAG: lipopolysaccharide biosynthesis protein [Marinospirillum sp.]|uniref:lipopolysaccharide biosynthesis protein n=1 Tax=Marinospirillum sp. TaxID=2183934 RepID=UPI0019E4D31D|nr:lipopolysaccharide biosynthesis protein [Marinospirillum sp.]MBE0505976.1 lipopolysaccharide biosynthesis protein [Marinospirillum sp.]